MIYSVRRFSDPNQDDQQKKSGMGTLGKVALGVGTAAAAFGAAKGGMFGASAMRGANTLWARGGSLIGGDIGNKMVKSGATGVQKATSIQKLNEVKKGLEEGAKVTGAMRRDAVAAGQEAGQGILDKFLKPVKEAVETT